MFRFIFEQISALITLVPPKAISLTKMKSWKRKDSSKLRIRATNSPKTKGISRREFPKALRHSPSRTRIQQLHIDVRGEKEEALSLLLQKPLQVDLWKGKKARWPRVPSKGQKVTQNSLESAKAIWIPFSRAKFTSMTSGDCNLERADRGLLHTF